MVKLAINGNLDQSIQKKVLIFISLTFFVLSFTILQDFLHAQHNNYSFYISESTLFNSFWVLFFPISFLQFYTTRKWTSQKSKISILYQIVAFTLSASIIHILLFPACVFLLSAVFFNHTYSFQHNLAYTISEDLYNYILVYGAIGFSLFQKSLLAANYETDSSFKPVNSLIDKIIIETGRNRIVVLTENIHFIRSSSPYVTIHTLDKKHLHSETLKTLLGKLDPNQFIKIHKSHIVNIKKVVSFKSRLNGDYDVLLVNQQEIRLSRNYGPAFKELLKKHSPS
jgi:two-component system, LytTR family, response regulator